jgi:hypothetical protein
MTALLLMATRKRIGPWPDDADELVAALNDEFNCNHCHRRVSKLSLLGIVAQLYADGECLWLGYCSRCVKPKTADFVCSATLIWPRA